MVGNSLASHSSLDICLAVEVFQHVDLLLCVWHHGGVVLGVRTTIHASIPERQH